MGCSTHSKQAPTPRGGPLRAAASASNPNSPLLGSKLPADSPSLRPVAVPPAEICPQSAAPNTTPRRTHRDSKFAGSGQGKPRARP
jgi:hypothetical protein